MATQIRQLAQGIMGGVDSIDRILLEEINRGISRMGQKTLDGLHFILMDEFERHGLLEKVIYRDSDGTSGWRTRLGLRLTEMDKKANAEHKKLNKRKKKGSPDLIIINKKHLAARFVNAQLGTNFEVDQDPQANDVVDAIGLGLAFFLDLEANL